LFKSSRVNTDVLDDADDDNEEELALVEQRKKRKIEQQPDEDEVEVEPVAKKRAAANAQNGKKLKVASSRLPKNSSSVVPSAVGVSSLPPIFKDETFYIAPDVPNINELKRYILA
jgi:hypothetical protein